MQVQNKRRVLLTGSSGFLGRYIYNHLLDECDLYTLNRSGSSFNVNLAEQVPDLRNYNFDSVIHLAGLTPHRKKNYLNNSMMTKVNYCGTNNLLKGIIPANIKNIVFISSVSVYGLSSGNLIDENMPLNYNDSYGESKARAEELIINYCKINNIRYTILRLPLVIGQNSPGTIRSMAKAIRFGYYFNINHGDAKKSMVLASDVAKYILPAASIGGIYNLTDGYHPSMGEVSEKIALQLKKKYLPNMPIGLAKAFAKTGDYLGHSFPFNSKILEKAISYLTFDDTRARFAFGWQPKRIIDQKNIF